VTLGAAGAFVAASDVAERFGRKESLARAGTRWRGTEVRVAALPLSGELNANGAGDAFTAGLLAALLWNEGELALEQVALLGAASARQRVDSARRGRQQSVRALLEELRGHTTS
jgi:sugar/nucleoside kinase (ribokinase family)